jgi:two-component system chemotaxis response regulator CheY
MAVKVLVVDDSPILRRMIARTLEGGGLPVAELREAADGSAALEAMRDHAFDLVLMDVAMPNLDGISALRTLRAAPATRTTPVVIVSTEGSAPRLAEIAELGATFVRKPFTAEGLFDAIAQAIRGAA